MRKIHFVTLRCAPYKYKVFGSTVSDKQNKINDILIQLKERWKALQKCFNIF